MSTFDHLSVTEQERLEVAASWCERLRLEHALGNSHEFREWISDPANSAAFEAVANTMALLEGNATSPAILDMRRAALARLPRVHARRWSGLRAIAAAVIVLFLAAGSGTYLYFRADNPTSYETDIGERKVVALPDGSRISLDSDSEVLVRYTEASRTLTLERGRARFDVAHDTKRPFTVMAGAKTVVAVGTSFNVERLGTKVLVTLIEGRILIKKTGAKDASPEAKATIRLTAGEQMAAVDNSTPVVRPANLDVATAWEAGQLVFRGEPLAEAAERVNRYTDNPILVDQSAASIEISGVFHAGDVGAFVNAMTEYFPVDATTDFENRIQLKKRS